MLFLLEPPGPKPPATGFVSRDNPSPTARNLRRFLAKAGIARERTAVWNAVPWYIGTGRKIRAAGGADVKEGAVHLRQLLPLFPQLRAVVLVGRKAQSAQHVVERLTDASVFTMLHPSNQVVGCFTARRAEMEQALGEVAAFLARPRGVKRVLA